MKKEITEEQYAVAKEVLGGDANVDYMILGAGLRRELTLQLLDALIEARAQTQVMEKDRNHWRNEYNYWRRLVPIRELDDRG